MCTEVFISFLCIVVQNKHSLESKHFRKVCFLVRLFILHGNVEFVGVR